MGMAWGHCHLRHRSRTPGGPKGPDGSSPASGAAKGCGNQELLLLLLLLLRVSATHPHPQRVGQGLAPVGMRPCIPSKTPAEVPLASWCDLTPSCARGAPPGSTLPPEPRSRVPPSPATCDGPLRPLVPSGSTLCAGCAFTLFPLRAPKDLSRRCHLLHARSTIAEIAASR